MKGSVGRRLTRCVRKSELERKKALNFTRGLFLPRGVGGGDRKGGNFLGSRGKGRKRDYLRKARIS